VTQQRHSARVILLMCMSLGSALPAVASGALPEGFVYIDDVIPAVQVELRYATSNNFVGHPIDGYLGQRCIMTRQAAEALRKVQEELKPFELGLKIYDAYRPQRAVDDFLRWAKDVHDTAMKSRYYPHVKKSDLFRDGYVARKSSHSRGSTVDLTIVSLAPATRGHELDMGSRFDFFGPQSWPLNPSLSPAQRAHRLLLRALMIKHGFTPYRKEWWHFTLKNEPYPDRYFNFVVE
jgi:D-alanyl-D-alanine dipeptidase